MSSRSNWRKAEDKAADTHLALLGVKIVRNGILGFQKKKEVQKNFIEMQKRINEHKLRMRVTKERSCILRCSFFPYSGRAI